MLKLLSVNVNFKVIVSVKNIMSQPVISVDMDDSLGFVKALFDSRRIHHVVVLENEQIVGIVSDRDVLRAMSPNVGTSVSSTHDDATLNKRVHQIMTRRPITIPSSTSLYDAVDIILDNGISCLPIVDSQLKPLGIVTWRDILKVISERHHNATV